MGTIGAMRRLWTELAVPLPVLGAVFTFGYLGLFGGDDAETKTSAPPKAKPSAAASADNTQGFLTPSCRLALHQRADGGSRDDRNHVRLRQRSGRDRYGRRLTLGDAHFENHVGEGPFKGCGLGGGHAVSKGTLKEPTSQGSGFDQGRRAMRDAWLRRGRNADERFAGNTHPFKQCDGDEAASNGEVAYMAIPKRRSSR